MAKSLIVIPARLAATRLPDKPMAEIAGEAMIVHVWRRAIEANCGPVLVATDADSVFDAVAKAGGEAVMTRPDHASGSDRIHEALQQVDPDRRVDTIVNLQGDLPTLDPGLVHTCVAALEEGNADIGTIAAEIVRDEERTNPNVVKVVGSPLPRGGILPLETREKLEQLRALEAGLRIHVGLVDTVPLGVDTPADLARAREILTSA
jgi:3-deoxy-manno-octulosonate cytidylyltransferase (CMP-KDO synthetase)